MIAAVTQTLPSVKELSREQRVALMRELVKAHFEDAGMPFPFIVRDGDKVIGEFRPVFHPPKSPTPIELPPEYLARIAEQAKNSKGMTREEALDYINRTYEQSGRE